MSGIIFHLSLFALCIAPLFVHAAEPKLNYFFPAGAQRGETTTVTASGKFDSWPLDVWVDRPGLEIDSLEKKGELKVNAANAKPGVYHIRLFDKSGASSVVPFIIDQANESKEVEPNNRLQESTKLTLPQIVNAKLANGGDIDDFAVDLKEGQTLVASLVANRVLDSPMDSVMQLTDSRGFVLKQNNDTHGLDPQIVYTAKQAGTYHIRVFAFPSIPNSTIGYAGGDTYIYRLSLTTGPFVDHASELVATAANVSSNSLKGWQLENQSPLVINHNEGDQTAYLSQSNAIGFATVAIETDRAVLLEEDQGGNSLQVVEIPAVVNGALSKKSEVDRYEFTATKGQRLSIKVEAHALGFFARPCFASSSSIRQ